MASLVAYPNGGAPSPTACPSTTNVANECTLAEAISLVQPGQTIGLTQGNYELSKATPYEISTVGTSATSPVSIVGSSTTNLIGRPGFVVDPGVYVKLSGFELEGFLGKNNSAYGGCIDDEGGLTLTKMTVDACRATVAGGGVYVGPGASLAVTSSTFLQDTAANDGGAIDASDGDSSGSVTIAGSTFSSDTTSSGNGGAIDNGDDGGSGTVTIKSSSFIDDTAGGAGGAIDNGGNGGSGTVTVSASVFSHNSSGGDGGAIANADVATSSGTLTVTSSSFTENNSSIDGGAISNQDNGGSLGAATVTVSSTAFTGNFAAYDGGDVTNNGDLSLKKSTFANSQGSDGGAVSTGGSYAISGSSFADEYANSNGGAIYAYAGGSVTTSTFEHDQSGYGGAIDCEGEVMSVSTSTFLDNSVYGDGGAISVEGIGSGGGGSAVAEADVTTSTFTDNGAAGDGGAIVNDNGTVSLTASTISGDNANDGGGLADVDSGKSAVVDSTFTGDSTHGGAPGAAIATIASGSPIVTPAQVDIVGTTIDANTGALQVSNDEGSVTIASTIVGDSGGDNCSGTITDAGYNIEDDYTNECFSNVTDAVPPISVGLGALASNGGPTQTMLPASQSPVEDQIPNKAIATLDGVTYTVCGGRDQRGILPVSPGTWGCAIGAVQAINTLLPIVSKVSPASGAPGAVVTITGQNLGSVATILVGGVSATITPETATSLKIVVPSGPSGSVAVEAYNPYGGSPYRPTASFNVT